MKHITRTLSMATAGAVLISGAAFAQEGDLPDTFTVATASQGGTYFIYGAGWANLVAEELGIQASTESTDGPVQNATLVHTGDVDFGMVTMGPALAAWEGESPLAPGEEHTDMRAVFPMYQTPFEVIALAGSGIEGVSDLEGKRVGAGPAGGTPGTYVPEILETLGINAEISFGGASDQAGQVQDGLIDAFAFAAGLPIAAFAELNAQTDVNIFAFTDEEVQTLVDSNASFSPYTIAGGTYDGFDEDRNTIAMWNMAIAHKDVPEELVYQVTKIVMENNERMVSVHSAAAETLPENFEYNTFLPWHPGAVRWFEENGYDIPDELVGE
ncbi:TAXI family TRAP transporter solute-binding subunit [Pararhizobium haloflavum]|uniref:TAXI family TRAP transporter solute-binding subunit n=1 Tax=Pararhizobium haloflavum TaxID=2037914 RepID=UPI000C190092|nr:TAXI family TRAP transporter solute-binding subunit [Pararhizobium haloflavum]